MLLLALLADDASDTSQIAHQALPYVVVALIFFAIILWFVMAQSSPTGHAIGHAFWGSPMALFIFCVLAAIGLSWGLPTVYKKMGFNPLGGSMSYQTFSIWTGVVVAVVFFMVMIRRILKMRRVRAWRGY